MKPFLFLYGVVALAATAFAAQDRHDAVTRLDNAAVVLEQVMSAPDKGVPEEVFSSAKCVAVVPSFKKAAFIFGGDYGRGVVTCRTDKGWSAPAFFDVKGGSWGLQIGGEEVDLVMLVMNDNGMRRLLSSKFELGGNASVAAGPVGRHASADTDWKMRAEVLTYSRSRGVFAGLSLEGSVIKHDQDSTRAFYGHLVPFRTILSGEIAAPTDASRFLSTVAKYGGTAKQAGPAGGASPTPAPPKH